MANAAPTTEAKPASPHIEIREYLPEDHDDVAMLVRDGLMQYTKPGHEHYDFWVNYLERSLATDVADIPGHYQSAGCNFFIVTAVSPSTGQRVTVGTLGVQKVSNEVAELRRVSVKTEYRRYGIGRLLMAHATQWIRAQGYKKTILHSASTQLQAIEFYKSLGYTVVKTSVRSQDPYFELTHFEKDLE
uniref:N-acetyltransferase domain-containing protein n=1 Tax=Globisporangium ultimum (strain ATCC 200006 / CBS 805.95 / DAOM BR144) TaxID=431595 RepID=K3XAQ7_GLOUD